MNNIDLLSIGDISIDLYMKVDASAVASDSSPDEKEPKICFYHGSKVPVERFGTSVAGNACHVAIGCTKLGLKTGIYSELGDDPNAAKVISEFKDFGIDTEFCIKNKDTSTNVHAVIVYGEDRTIFSYHEKRDYKMYNWPKPKWVFYSSLAKGFENFQGELVDYLKKNDDVLVGFNPGTLQLKSGLDNLRNILSLTDVLFINKEEAQMLLGMSPERDTPLETLHKSLGSLGPKLNVITLGKGGSSAYDGNTVTKMGIYGDGKGVVDKTGAGDAYTAAFISALFYKKPLKTAMKWGATNSAHTVKIIGGVDGLLNKIEIEKKSEEFFGQS